MVKQVLNVNYEGCEVGAVSFDTVTGIGAFGFATEYNIERKFREARLDQVAPMSTNLILSHVATHDLGLPKSF